MKSDYTKAAAKNTSEDKRNKGKWSRKGLFNWTSKKRVSFLARRLYVF